MHPNDISSQKNAFRPRRVDAPPKGMVKKKNEKNVKRIIFGTGKSWVVGGEKMKVQNISDIEGFFKVVDSCKGKVELVTGEGDRLNLKSKLSQYVSMANIFSNGEIPELEVIAYEPEDTDKLINFMMHGGK